MQLNPAVDDHLAPLTRLRSQLGEALSAHRSLFGPALVVSGVVLMAQGFVPEVVWDLTREDGVVENMTALAWILAALAFVGLSIRSDRRLGPLLLGGLTLLIALEEISWGQRLFDVSSPSALEAINRQDEINIHNTEILHHLMRPLSLVVAGVLVLGPALIQHGPARFAAWTAKLGLPVCPVGLRFLWLSASVVTLSPILVRGTYYGPFDELGELLMGLQFLFFGAALARRATDRSPVRMGVSPGR